MLFMGRTSVSLLQVSLPFAVSILKVDQLELRVTARDKSQHCHAVWVDPALTVSGAGPCSYEMRACASWFLTVMLATCLQKCEDWVCAGWKNDKESFVCNLSGCERGTVSPAQRSPTVYCLRHQDAGLHASCVLPLHCLFRL